MGRGPRTDAGVRQSLDPLALRALLQRAGIPPSAIDDEAVAAYDAFIRTQTFKIRPGRHLRDTCLLWNRLAAIAPDLQLRPVTLPSNRVTYTPPWEALPASFRAEAEGWLVSMSEEGDLLSEKGPTRPLQPASLKAYRFALRQAIAGLLHSARQIETIDSLGALIAPGAAEAALQLHIDRTGNKPSQMLAQIASVLVLVAHAVGADNQVVVRLGADFPWLRRARARLKARARPSRDKRRQIVPARDLFLLGLELMKRAERAEIARVVWRAALYRDGLMITLLACRPIRRGSLAAMRIGEHLVQPGTPTRLHSTKR